MIDNISYDIKDLKKLEKDINRYGNELINDLDTILKGADELDNIYDTPTGKLFKEKLTEYLLREKAFIKDNYLTLGDIMQKVNNEYSHNIEKVKKAVGGN